MPQRNAIILAAGTSSRFVPLSYESPKGLLEVKGEVLIERQIRQLKEAGINDICIVVGYKAEMFSYLRDKYGVDIVFNEDFKRYNNTSSLIRVLDRLADTFICSSDNYFPENVFLTKSQSGYYSACHTDRTANEYCLTVNDRDEITKVEIGGRNAWYMIGHVYFNHEFSSKFKEILLREYQEEATRHQYWEDVYIRNISRLPALRVNRYPEGGILEFDSIDELRRFDSSYVDDTRSSVVKDIAHRLGCSEANLSGFSNISTPDKRFAFHFYKDGIRYSFDEGEIILPSEEEHGKRRYDREALLRHLKTVFPDKDMERVELNRIGGMSNKNFLVRLDGKGYVLRVPGYGSDGMVERANEQFNALAACKLGINPPIRYFNVTTGIKVVDFIDNAETLTAETVQIPANMDRIAHIYRKLHNSATTLRNNFNIFREIEKYDRLLAMTNGVMYDGWTDLRPKVMALEEYIKTLGVDLKPCHNDALYENFIKAPDGTIYLIDWEYSGMNDPMADFAALFLEADFKKENEDYILDRYFNGHVPDTTHEKILCFQILWDCLWAQWTVIKESNGDDFGSYGIDRFNRAISNLNKINTR